MIGQNGQEFTENLVDERVPVHRDVFAIFSRDSASEPRSKVVSAKHSIYIHFPDKDHEICKRTSVTIAPCRKRTGAAVLRPENFVFFLKKQITKFSVKAVNLETIDVLSW